MTMSRRCVDASASASDSLSSAHDFRACFPDPPCWRYDVFLSFQGEGPSGSRNNFTDVLYTTLCRKGIVTFKDDEELKKGRVIGNDLIKAIEDSALFLVVLSRDYASSKWCLDELTKIMECSIIRRKSLSSSLLEAFVIPIFHEVEAKDVRTQKGSFEESFLRHEQDDAVDKEKVRKWKSAMTNVGNLSGWVTHGRKWTEIANEIAQLVFNRTNHHWSSLSDNLVGFDSHLQNIMAHLSVDSICFLGICGMGGIGKTALAELVHKQISHCFEESIFLRSIREISSKVDGLMSLQKRLILKLFSIKSESLDEESNWVELIQKRLSQKKVLIILDDVDDSKQLEAFALGHDCFKNGSKVIITTRDERLLNVHEAILYRLEELNKANSLKLFCRKAFHSNSPLEGFVELSHHFIEYAKGLPLALEVLGSSLYKRDISEWQSELSKLAKIPIEKVTSTLRISFDGLDEIAKKVFLHIACFFNGKSKHRVLDILSSCYGFSLNHVISLLKERSLVKELSDEKLWMHDLIQEMGREVVYQESPDHPGRRNLLWDSEDIYSVLRYNTGTELVKGIVLTSPMVTFRPLSAKAFSKMTKLRVLTLPDVPFCDNLDYLSSELRFLEWKGFPFRFLPTSFEAENLVELKLPNSHLKELWHGTKYFMHLKTLKLSHSKSLSKTPNFTGTPHLEKIILEGCLRLHKVDKSIGILEKLTLLSLKDCEQLKTLPDSICDLQSLRRLDLSGCSSLIAYPRNMGSLKCLEELTVDGKVIKKPSISLLSCFSSLAPGSSRNSRELCVPPLLGFTSLRKLILDRCNLSDVAIPDDIGRLHALEGLSVRGNMFVKPPPFFTQLTNIKKVWFMECKALQHAPTLPSSVEQVYFDDCPSLELLPDQLFVNTSKESYTLSFLNCQNLVGNYGGSSNVAKMLLENYLGSLKHHATHDMNRFFNIWIPGNSIPTWISNRSRGCSVSIDLPDFDDLQRTFCGLLVCCVVTLDKHQDADTRNNRDKADDERDYYTHRIGCRIETNAGVVCFGQYFSRFRKHCLQPESNNLWFHYVSHKNFQSDLPLDCKRITISLNSVDATIKSCGAALMFEKKHRPTQACQIAQLD